MTMNFSALLGALASWRRIWVVCSIEVEKLDTFAARINIYVRQRMVDPLWLSQSCPAPGSPCRIGFSPRSLP
jgi:hypothetical protein